MSYDLRVEEDGYIRVTLHGQLTQEDIDQALEEILSIRQKQNVKNILCDQRDLQAPPHDIVVYETAKRFASGPFMGMRLAILRTKVPIEHLFETVARNRAGLVRVFDDEEKAKQWFHGNKVKHAGLAAR